MSDVGRVTENPNTENGAAGQSVAGGGSVIDTDSHRRQVKLTQKGLEYQIELKNKLLKSKRTEFQEKKKQIILLKGVCADLRVWKKEFGQAQIILEEYRGIFEEFKNLFEGMEEREDYLQTKAQVEQFQIEWDSFEQDVRLEIRFLEEYQLETASIRSKGSRRSEFRKDNLAVKIASELQKKETKLQLQLEEIEEEKKTKLQITEEKRRQIECQQKEIEDEVHQKETKLKAELTKIKEEINSQKLSEENEDEESQYKQDLSPIPTEGKEEKLSRFFESQEESSRAYRYEETESNGWMKIASSLERCVEKLAETNKEQNELNRQLVSCTQLPKLDVPVFDGDPLKYPSWKHAFTALIDSKVSNVDSKLSYLRKYIGDDPKGPKALVEHYLLLGTEDAYRKAIEAIEDRYGNSSVIATAFINKIDNWRNIDSRDSTGLRAFSDFLDEIVVAKTDIKELGVLDYAKENAKMVGKLPYYLDSRWRDTILSWRDANGKNSFPPLTKFAEFVKKAAEKANLPELNNNDFKRTGYAKSTSNTHRSYNNNRPNGRSFLTSGVHEDKKPTYVNTDSDSCLFCNEKHHIDDCKQFMKKSRSEKKAFFFRKRLCMGCASSRSHYVADCNKKKTCKICKGDHLTCFHISKSDSLGDKATSHCMTVCSLPDQDGREHSMIVPVWIRHRANPSKEFLEYLVVDDQSNVGFVGDNVCDKLNITGPETNLRLSTMHGSNKVIHSRKIYDLEVLDFKREHIIQLPGLFTRDSIPASRSQIPKQEVVRQWSHLKEVADQLMPYNSNVEISILIGNDCTRIVRPRAIITGKEDEPYGQKSILGWGVIGRVCKSKSESENNKDINGICNKIVASETYSNFVFNTKVKEIFDGERLLRIMETDFTDILRKPYSVEDEKFLKTLEDGIKKRPDGHYEMPLPLKSSNVSLPNNYKLALKRWNQLTGRFRKNPKFLADYQAFMKDLIDNCAERVPRDRLQLHDGRVNYIAHTGVYHNRKIDQIRVVFDCSAQYEGISLNDILLQGPDLMNGLLGILCRFREDDIAFMTDIKGMFHQFFVSEEHRDLLRFIWWEDGDPERDLVHYRMKVHLFGATSSPGCANFGLKKAADDGVAEYGEKAAEFIKKDFYVDDGLKSVSTVSEAIELIKSSQKICAKAGLRLHKIISNRKEVLEAIPNEDRSKKIKELDLQKDPLPLERALGIVWCVEKDVFQFRIEFRDRPFSRRGILATISSIYDPNGYVAPVTLKGKQILQQMCRDKLDWDSVVPEYLHPVWEKWRQDIMELEKLEIPRCYKPKDFGDIKAVELHHFSDASECGIGQSSYLRIVNSLGEVHCSFVIGKARVTPLKVVTVPRLELVAATISAKMSTFLRNELTYENVTEFFWTDSRIVLGYLKNEAKRFHTFVANRVQQIRNQTDPDKWFFVKSESNVADLASRGLTAKQLVEDSTWLAGPPFLWQNQVIGVNQEIAYSLDEADDEVKKATVLSTNVSSFNVLESDRFIHISSWYKCKRAVASCLQLKKRLQKKSSNEMTGSGKIGVSEFEEAEKEILKILQKEHFEKELEILQSRSGVVEDRTATRDRNKKIKKYSSLFRLDPFLDKDGLIRVGGRIQRANIPPELKHPAIIPSKSHLTKLLITHYHQKVNHMGRGITHNELRQNGYWVINGSSAVARLISQCVTCRRLRGSLQTQKMSDLPEDRVEPAPPFSYCAVDYFGPFLIKERRSQVKRYGVLFTCMASRAVHLETAVSLSSSSFINALSRFLNRRGPVRVLRSDQGTNFIGARNELKTALSEMDQDQVHKYLLQNDCEWIKFNMNCPHSSHMGGAWERQILTVRNALETLLMSSGQQLDDESFRTFMTEVECIINSRPLSVINLSDPEGPEPLTPNHLLTMKPKVVLPPPGQFQRDDIYSQKWWRRVQFLANEFWLRWRKEYLQNLQYRSKWSSFKRNLQVGDIVISKEADDQRNKWPLARVTEVYKSHDGEIRKVKILMADRELTTDGKRRSQPTYLDRPIHKLVLLLAAETSENSNGEPGDQDVIPVKEPDSVPNDV